MTEVSPAVSGELGCDTAPLIGPLDRIGTRLDDVTFDEVCNGTKELRIRLGAELDDRPIRLRRLHGTDAQVWLELRSLADHFRMESLLRRSGVAHMLLSPRVELQWSMSSNELSDVLPGDDPMSWIELMDADDMQTLGRTIAAVGADPNLRRTVKHRLNADRTYTIIDTVESAMHDPDLRAVLVRSRLATLTTDNTMDGAAPYSGITVSDHMPIGVVLASDAGKVLHRNAVAAELVGARIGQLVVPDGDQPWMLARLNHEHSAQYQSVFAAASAGQSAHCTIPSPFEPERWLRLSISPAAASTVVLTIEDTTDLAQAERALRTSNRLLEALDSHSEDLVIVFDALGRSRHMNSSARRELGDGAPIEHLDEVVTHANDTDRGDVLDLIRRVRSHPSASGAIDFRVVRAGDPIGRWHHATMTNHLDDPDVQGLVLTVRDNHERHIVGLDLEFKATHDALTTLPGRAALQSRLDAVLRESGRVTDRTALMFVDLDNFKMINDRAGHRIGDVVLLAVADRLRSALRDSDFVGRFGGDEFVVVAPRVVDEAHALELAERLFKMVAGPVRCDDFDVDVSASLGVALTDAECSTSASLLHRADVAMYRAKGDGRGRVVLYSDEQHGDDDDAALRSDLGAAISDRQLTVHYQPLVPLTTGLPRGYESLARWEHPVRGTIGAQRFLAIAELTGFTSELGDELVRLVADDDRPWLADGAEFLCVNLSSAQLSQPLVASSFLERMRRANIDPQRIVIELTESAFGQGPTVRTALQEFRDAGARVFLDDFGVGYSSLSQLHNFPVDGIKIASSIVHPTVDESLVRLLVGVATALDIRTVAEGVESTEQLDTVARLGVDYAQGYLLGRPARVPASGSVR